MICILCRNAADKRDVDPGDAKVLHSLCKNKGCFCQHRTEK